MGKVLYTIFIYFYNFLVFWVSRWNQKVYKMWSGRRETLRLLNDKPEKENPLVWIHCSSLGEFEQGRPIIEELSKKDIEVVLTFFSPSGYDLHKDYKHADFVYYLPSDTPKNAKKFIERINPDLAVFIKYEFWINYIETLKNKEIPLLSVSSIFRPSQIFFRRYASFYLKAIKDFTHFFVQDDSSKALLIKHGIDNITVSGDTRFDRVSAISKTPFTDNILDEFCGSKKVVVVGSCWKEDLVVLKPIIEEFKKEFKFIIAPHQLDEASINIYEQELDSTVRYTKTDNPDAGIMLIDNMGMLSKLYRYGTIAYVGGAFGDGLHNILEPAVYGIPVFFGNKNFHKFKEANDLKSIGAAFSVADSDQLRSMISAIDSESKLTSIKMILNEYFQRNLGATDDVVKYCLNELQKK